MNATITRATVDHALRIKLRQCDLDEAAAWVPGADPADLLSMSVLIGRNWAALEGEEVVALGGYYITGNRLVPWLMASDLLDKHHKQLLRLSRSLLADLIERHPGLLICNHVARDNAKARLYLKSLGFTIVTTPGADAKFDFFFK